MILDVYDIKKIGVPAKCGSRYFAKARPYFGFPKRCSFREFYLREFELEYIIIRNPLEHLKSALQTEVMECFNDIEWIGKILKSYKELYNGGSHFYPKFCEKVYEVWYKGGYKLKVVELSNLSKFMEQMFQNIPYNEFEYNFHWDKRYVSKEDVWNRCILLYPDLMNDLIEYATNDIKYYNALLNGDKSLVKLI